MENETQPTAPKPPRKRRFLRRSLIALAWLASIIALFYGIVDWHGRRAWNEYRRDYEARVAPLDYRAYIPGEIPESENFAATPIAEAFFKQRNDTNFLLYRDPWTKAGRMPELRSSRLNEPYAAGFEDLVAWQEIFAAIKGPGGKPKEKVRSHKLDAASRAAAAPAVLAGLKEDEPVFEELRAAAHRPQARYDVVYDLENPWAILLPHLFQIKQLCQRLKLKACAELALGQTDQALEDIKLMLYLADTVKSEPFMISYMVRAACIPIALQPVREGLAEHRWTDAQLQQLQSRVGAYNFLADLQMGMHAERAAGVLTMDLFQKRGLGAFADLAKAITGESGGSSPSGSLSTVLLNAAGRIAPSGWYDLEKLHYCQAGDRLFANTMDPAARRVYPSVLEKDLQGFTNMTLFNALIHGWLFEAFMYRSPSLLGIPQRASVPQVVLDEAATACALERYRLANGEVPDNLQALVPRFMAQLPADIFSGGPLKYRRTADGSFVLYSVGWNERDDGGVSGVREFDVDGGDWVWENPVGK